MRERTRKGAGMERQIAIRFDAPVYDHLQQVAAELGLSLTEYIRLMACWDAPYLLPLIDATKILQTGGDDPGQTIPRLRSAVARLEAGERDIDALVERIHVGLVETQQRSRAQAAELKVILQEQLAPLNAYAEAFRTIRKRLGTPPAGTKEKS